MRNFVFSVVAFSLMASPATALIYSFDTPADLQNNFNKDVFFSTLGDAGITWEPGYVAQNGFPGSNGGYILFDDYRTPASLQFKTGPVFLNSFTISSQRFGNGDGVQAAQDAGNNYHLRLYDGNNNILLDQQRIIASGGVWETLTFDLANVWTIWIGRTDDGNHLQQGWWPVIDGIRVNEQPNAVPLPAALPLFATGLAGLSLLAWRKKRKMKKARAAMLAA